MRPTSVSGSAVSFLISAPQARLLDQYKARMNDRAGPLAGL